MHPITIQMSGLSSLMIDDLFALESLEIWALIKIGELYTVAYPTLLIKVLVMDLQPRFQTRLNSQCLLKVRRHC